MRHRQDFCPWVSGSSARPATQHVSSAPAGQPREAKGIGAKEFLDIAAQGYFRSGDRLEVGDGSPAEGRALYDITRETRGGNPYYTLTNAVVNGWPSGIFEAIGYRSWRIVPREGRIQV